MSIRVEYVVDTAKGEANLKGLASAAEGMGQKSSRAQTELMKLTAEMERAQEQALRLNAKMLLGADVMQKAVTRMNDMHEEALRMSGSMKGTSDAADLLASNVGKVGSIATSTASALGAPASALGALGGAFDLATMQAGGMAKVAPGFNAATLGMVGAAAGLGVGIGTLARDLFPDFASSVDDMAGTLTGYKGQLQDTVAAQGAFAVSIRAGVAAMMAMRRERQGTISGGSENRDAEQRRAQDEIARVGKELDDNKKRWADQAAAAKAAGEAFRKATAEWSGAAAQKEMNGLEAQIAAVGGTTELSAAKFAELADKLKKLSAEGAVATGSLKSLQAAQQAIAQKVPVASPDMSGLLPPTAPGGVYQAALGPESQAIIQAQNARDQIRAMFQEDVTAQARGQLAKAWDAELMKMQEAARNQLAATIDYVLNVVAAVQQLPAAFAAATDSANGLTRLLGGAAVGGQFGALIGKMIPIPGGEALGKIAGSLIGGIAGLFKKPSWVKVGKDAGKVLGVEIGEEMAKQIEATAKKLNVSVKVAALLNLDQVIGDSGKSASSFAPQIMDLMKGIADGSIPAAEGMEQLNDAFARLVDEAESGSAAASKLMVQMLQLGRSTKTTTAEMKAFTDSSLKSAQDGVAAMIAANTIAVVSSVEKLKKDGEKIFKTVFDDDATMANAQAQGYIFAAAFWATAGEEGIVAAGRAFGDSWEAYKEQLREAEIDPEALAAITGPIDAVMSLFQNETTKGLLEGLDGATQAVKGLGDAGYMTQGAFDALGQQAGATFQALAGEGGEGVDPTVALQAIAPALAEVQRQSEMYGLTIDANTQSLIDQANAAGIAFPTDPLQAIVQILQETLDLMRQINRLPVDIKTNSPNVTVPNPNGNGFPVGPPQAEGGYTPANTPTWRLFGEGNEGEYVVPESQMGKMGGVTIGQGAVQVNLGDVTVSNGIELADLQAAIEQGSAQGIVTALKMAGVAA